MVTIESLTTKVNVKVLEKRKEGLVPGNVLIEFDTWEFRDVKTGKCPDAYFHYPGIPEIDDDNPKIRFASNLLFGIDCGDVIEADFDRLIEQGVNFLLKCDDVRRLSFHY